MKVYKDLKIYWNKLSWCWGKADKMLGGENIILTDALTDDGSDEKGDNARLLQV